MSKKSKLEIGLLRGLQEAVVGEVSPVLKNDENGEWVAYEKSDAGEVKEWNTATIVADNLESMSFEASDTVNLDTLSINAIVKLLRKQEADLSMCVSALEKIKLKCGSIESDYIHVDGAKYIPAISEIYMITDETLAKVGKQS